ncbi:hypothetical protein Zmor_014662 [Zophobas morio]|uniref:Uncharacterized protein n=1 Tax=Zophobas morio TaxID=2755281 RepID=A0AA38MGL4_9CUCU|nr:hypothetical protein Zmor_014662 [Zophobas morio]
MGPKPKKAVPNAQSDIQSIINQCLVDFFDQSTVDCGCAADYAVLHEEIGSCKTLIVAQTALIQQLQSVVSTLQSEILQLKSAATRISNEPNHTIENRRISAPQQPYNVKNNDRKSLSTIKDNVFTVQPAELLNMKNHRQGNPCRRSDLHLFPEVQIVEQPEDSSQSDEESQFETYKKSQIKMDDAHSHSILKDDGFVQGKSKNLHKKMTHNKKKNYVIGTSQSDQSNMLKAAPKKALLYVSRLRPGTTEDQILNFLKNDFPEVKVQPLVAKYPEYYSSFKIIVDLVNKEKAMDGNRWPQGTYISRFFHRRSKAIEEK